LKLRRAQATGLGAIRHDDSQKKIFYGKSVKHMILLDLTVLRGSGSN